MKLSNFQNYIDPIILARGLDYYRSGYVESLAAEDDTWIAEVSGTELYEITVELGEDGEIIDSDCDCPYDGEYCKHEVAVFYALRAHFRRGGAPEPARKKSPPWVWPPLKNVLQSQSSAALAAELLTLAKHNDNLQEQLQLRFASEPDRMVWAEAALRQIAGAPNSDKVRTRLDRVLWLARDETASPRHLAALCRAVLLALVPIVDKWTESDDDEDDWEEDDGWDDESEPNPFLYAIEQVIGSLDAPVAQLATCEEDAAWLWELLLPCAAELARCELLGEQLELYDTCVPLCRWAALRRSLTASLDNVRASEDERWALQFIERIELRILEAFDTPEAARSYRESHLDNPDFLRASVDAAMEGGRLHDALRLCPDSWLELRYQIYERLGDRDGQRTVAAELLIQRNDSFYEVLKSLYYPEEWRAERHRILSRLPWNREQIRLKILTTERMQPELWEICRRSPDSMLRLYHHLLPEYEERLRVWFKEQIRKDAERASSRNQYRDVCRLIVHLRKACGDKPAEAMRSELLLQNVRRPAFMDELRRIAPITRV